MKYFQSVLKKFDGVAAFSDNLLIQHSWNSPKPSIYAQLDDKNRNLDDWQAIVKQTPDDKAKTVWQVPALAQESDVGCSSGHKSSKYEEYKDLKESKIKKNHSLAADSNSENGG